MKYHLIIAAMAAFALSACTQLSEQDRSLLVEAHSSAQQAKSAAIEAQDEARAARADANKAAAEAKAASDKADRIFRQSQNK